MKVKKAIIPAAGLGTRFLPITKAIPKPMLSVLDKPNIQYILEELKETEVEEIFVIVPPNSEIIEKHFAKNLALEERLLSDGKEELYKIEQETCSYNVKFIEQKVANGLAGAILCAEPYLDNQPFALLLGDELFYAEDKKDGCIKKLIDVYEKRNKSVIATMEVFGDEVSKYGNFGIKEEIEDGLFLINELKEKPSLNEALSNYALIGRYVLSEKVIPMLKNLTLKNNELYLTDALEDLCKKGELLACTFSDKRYDVGDKAGFIKANIDFALKSKETKEEIKDYIKKLAKTL